VGTDRLLIFLLVPVPKIRDPDEWYEDLGPQDTSSADPLASFQKTVAVRAAGPLATFARG